MLIDWYDLNVFDDLMNKPMLPRWAANWARLCRRLIDLTKLARLPVRGDGFDRGPGRRGPTAFPSRSEWRAELRRLNGAAVSSYPRQRNAKGFPKPPVLTDGEAAQPGPRHVRRHSFLGLRFLLMCCLGPPFQIVEAGPTDALRAFQRASLALPEGKAVAAKTTATRLSTC